MPGKPESGAEDVAFHDREDYLEARVTGTYTLERFKRQITHILQACKDRGFHRVLVDVTAVTAFESAGTLDRFAMGEHGARLAGTLVSAALVGLPAQLDAESFGVMVAQNRGMNVRNFTETKAAVAWLTSDEAKPRG